MLRKGLGWKIAVVLESLIIVAAGVVFVYAFFVNDTAEHFLTKSVSPDEKVTVSIYEIGSASQFGASKIRIRVKGPQGYDTSFDTAVSNNGAKLTDGEDTASANYIVEWESDKAIVTLDGSQQKKVVYTVNFDDLNS